MTIPTPPPKREKGQERRKKRSKQIGKQGQRSKGRQFQFIDLIPQRIPKPIPTTSNQHPNTNHKRKQAQESKARGVAGPMGHPSFRGVILRDHGTERPGGLPTMGTAPKTQKLIRCKKKAMTPKGLFRRLAHPYKQATERDSMTDKTKRTPYHTISQSKERSIADTHRTPKRARVVSGGRREEAVGHRPPPRNAAQRVPLDAQIANRNRSDFKSLHSQCASQIATRIASKIQICRNEGRNRN